jgi:predicted DNA-binding transcriptional regulator YafY
MADRLERLVNLVIALREARVPLAASEIRTRVAGYGQSDREAFRRMFERDKADLRALGVPVETAPIDRWGDREGYRIDPARYDLPELDFPADELMALAVAVDATGMGDSAASGLRKLEIDAGRPGVTRASGTGRTPVIDASLAAPHLEVLAGAQLTRTTVRFSYRKAGGETASRTVDPYALVHRRGRWYVVGHDHGRAAQRAFRLDRIDGRVRTLGDPHAFDPPEGEVDVDAVVPAVPADAPRFAVVEASSEIAWQVARSARGAGEPAAGEWSRFTVPVGDPDAFIGWVLEQGPEIVIVEPADLRNRVVAALRRLSEGSST